MGMKNAIKKIYTYIFYKLIALANIEYIEIDMTRIGHAITPWIYLCANQNKKKVVIYLYSLNKEVCNSQWHSMWSKLAERYYESAGTKGRLIIIIRKIIFVLNKNLHFNLNDSLSDNEKLKLAWSNTDLLIDFAESEIIYGEDELKKANITKPFVCFFSRDDEYLNVTYPDRNWSYHDYRDSDIKKCLSACDYLVNKDYTCVRVGSIVKESLSPTSNKIIDYSKSDARTEFLDIYLSSRCDFFIGSDSGATQPSEIFVKPMVYHNWVLLNRISFWVRTGLFIFKQLWSENENRFITFDERINNKKYHVFSSKKFAELGVSIIENTSDEILKVVREMDLRLRGEWEEKDEDILLQEKFWSLFKGEITKSPKLLIGTEYLRQYEELL